MGLFSRKKADQPARSTRSTTSSEAQAAELRGRARRRLIGALVLVLTAVIIVPLMFDDTTSPQPDTPAVLPALVPPVPQPDLAAVTPPEYAVDEPVLSQDVTQTPGDTGVVTGSDAPASDAPAGAAQPAPASTQEQADATPVETAPSAPPAAPSATPRPEPEPASSPDKPADTRTDDGSVALALLEGRVPPSTPGTPAAAEQGSFVLQIAAYSTEADAQSRRNSLVSSGVTNAYVEKAVLNDKTTYRLRVGSFPSRDAALAAQTRLRALGYDNSLLLTQ